MEDKRPPIVTSVEIPSEEMPGLKEPIVVAAEETPIALRIRDALLAEPRLGGADLQVRVHADHARLSGEVHTEEQKDIALSIAGRFVGRDRVIDEIQTGGQIGYFCEA